MLYSLIIESVNKNTLKRMRGDIPLPPTSSWNDYQLTTETVFHFFTRYTVPFLQFLPAKIVYAFLMSLTYVHEKI
jgi:hypothetical protein